MYAARYFYTDEISDVTSANYYCAIYQIYMRVQVDFYDYTYTTVILEDDLPLYREYLCMPDSIELIEIVSRIV